MHVESYLCRFAPPILIGFYAKNLILFSGVWIECEPAMGEFSNLIGFSYQANKLATLIKLTSWRALHSASAAPDMWAKAPPKRRSLRKEINSSKTARESWMKWENPFIQASIGCQSLTVSHKSIQINSKTSARIRINNKIEKTRRHSWAHIWIEHPDEPMPSMQSIVNVSPTNRYENKLSKHARQAAGGKSNTNRMGERKLKATFSFCFSFLCSVAMSHGEMRWHSKCPLRHRRLSNGIFFIHEFAVHSVSWAEIFVSDSRRSRWRLLKLKSITTKCRRQNAMPSARQLNPFQWHQ